MIALPQARISLDACPEWEDARIEKHEFHRGEVIAMVGGRRVHGRVEGFRRDAARQWILHDMSDVGVLEVASIDTRVPLAEVFDGMDPPSPADVTR